MLKKGSLVMIRFSSYCLQRALKEVPQVLVKAKFTTLTKNVPDILVLLFS